MEGKQLLFMFVISGLNRYARYPKKIIIFSGEWGGILHFTNQNNFYPKTPPPVALSRKIFNVHSGPCTFDLQTAPSAYP